MSRLLACYIVYVGMMPCYTIAEQPRSTTLREIEIVLTNRCSSHGGNQTLSDVITSREPKRDGVGSKRLHAEIFRLDP